jgi:hypothetical protein
MITIPHELWLSLICNASMAAGYLGGGDPTQSQLAIAGRLKLAVKQCLDAAKFHEGHNP